MKHGGGDRHIVKVNIESRMIHPVCVSRMSKINLTSIFADLKKMCVNFIFIKFHYFIEADIKVIK